MTEEPTHATVTKWVGAYQRALSLNTPTLRDLQGIPDGPTPVSMTAERLQITEAQVRTLLEPRD